MPDPQATPPEAGQTATPPVASTTTAQPDFQLTDDARAAGFTEQDFAHPEYGMKAKNLYKGFQSRSEKAAKAEKDLSDWKAFVQSNPEVRDLVVQTVRKLNGLPPQDTPPDDDQPKDGKEDLAADLALNELYAHLGKGDPYAGRTTYAKEYAQDVEAELPYLVGRPADRLRKAMEIVTLRRRGAASSTTTPPPPPPPTTTASSETERGTGTEPPKKETDFSDEAIIARAMKKHGITDFTELAKLTGSLR